jgi:hypothetical protein
MHNRTHTGCPHVAKEFVGVTHTQSKYEFALTWCDRGESNTASDLHRGIMRQAQTRERLDTGFEGGRGPTNKADSRHAPVTAFHHRSASLGGIMAQGGPRAMA